MAAKKLDHAGVGAERGGIVVEGYEALGEAEVLELAPSFCHDQFGLGLAERVPAGAEEVRGVVLGVGYPGEDLGGEDFVC